MCKFITLTFSGGDLVTVNERAIIYFFADKEYKNCNTKILIFDEAHPLYVRETEAAIAAMLGAEQL